MKDQDLKKFLEERDALIEGAKKYNPDVVDVLESAKSPKEMEEAKGLIKRMRESNSKKELTERIPPKSGYDIPEMSPEKTKALNDRAIRGDVERRMTPRVDSGDMDQRIFRADRRRLANSIGGDKSLPGRLISQSPDRDDMKGVTRTLLNMIESDEKPISDLPIKAKLDIEDGDLNAFDRLVDKKADNNMTRAKDARNNRGILKKSAKAGIKQQIGDTNTAVQTANASKKPLKALTSEASDRASKIPSVSKKSVEAILGGSPRKSAKAASSFSPKIVNMLNKAKPFASKAAKVGRFLGPPAMVAGAAYDLYDQEELGTKEGSLERKLEDGTITDAERDMLMGGGEQFDMSPAKPSPTVSDKVAELFKKLRSGAKSERK